MNPFAMVPDPDIVSHDQEKMSQLLLSHWEDKEELDCTSLVHFRCLEYAENSSGQHVPALDDPQYNTEPI